MLQNKQYTANYSELFSNIMCINSNPASSSSAFFFPHGPTMDINKTKSADSFEEFSQKQWKADSTAAPLLKVKSLFKRNSSS